MAKKKLLSAKSIRTESSVNNINEKEKALAQMMKAQTIEKKTEKKDVHRYNIEIPLDDFERIKKHSKKRGYNLKGFFLAAAREKLNKEENEE